MVIISPPVNIFNFETAIGLNRELGKSKDIFTAAPTNVPIEKSPLKSDSAIVLIYFSSYRQLINFPNKLFPLLGV